MEERLWFKPRLTAVDAADAGVPYGSNRGTDAEDDDENEGGCCFGFWAPPAAALEAEPKPGPGPGPGPGRKAEPDAEAYEAP